MTDRPVGTDHRVAAEVQVFAIDLVQQHLDFPGRHVETEQSPIVIAHQQVPVGILLDAEWPPSSVAEHNGPVRTHPHHIAIGQAGNDRSPRSISTSSAPVLGSLTTDTGSVIGVPRRGDGGCQRIGRCDGIDPRVSFNQTRSSHVVSESK
jgi:hypothetical protein